MCLYQDMYLSFLRSVIVFVLDSDSSKTETLVGWLLLGLGAVMFFTDRNKVAVGIGAGAVSLFCFSDGLVTLYFEMLSNDLSIESFVSLMCGLLMLLGSVVMIFQKEARLGGSLCLYSFVVAAFYCIYQLINDNSIIELWNLSVCVASLSLFVWSYGYKSDASLSPIKQGLHVITYTVSCILVLLSTLAVVELFQ